MDFIPGVGTYEQRFTQAKTMANDPILTGREQLKVIYHWFMYEVAKTRRDRLQHAMLKHGTFMNDMADMANFRHELQDL